MLRAMVLVVEDDPDIRETICGILSDEGHDTRGAGSLHQAREKLAGVRIDVIVLDLGLPDGDGTELLAELRESGARQRVVIASASANAPAAARHFGVPFVKKPFDIDHLVSEVSAAIAQ